MDRATIASDYPGRDWIVAAWRIKVEFSDGVTRRFDLVAGAKFPTTPVRTALVDHPEPMTWPHVESDGILCLLPNMAECDPDDPSEVAMDLLNRSVRLVTELLDGSIIERDFREEFVTYWGYQAHSQGKNLFSLVAPTPPSRVVRVWRGKGIEVVAENQEAIAKWVSRRFGGKVAVNADAAAFLWLDAPLLPAEYPETAADLYLLSQRLGDDSKAALEQAASVEPDEILALLGAIGRGGAASVGVRVLNPKRLKGRPRAPEAPLSVGFRPGHTPRPLFLDRFFGRNSVIRTLVQRADAEWVHGRCRDSRTHHLLGASVAVIGCGSVGAPVACALAQAGVGRIILVDPETLTWPNVGRHPLGATAVGRQKAEALAERLRADFPHLSVGHLACDVHHLIEHRSDLLASVEVIVSATGSWAAESALNRWHIQQGRRQPIVYGWTEAHACAGHAVAIGEKQGCLQCHIGRTGAPEFTAVTWLNGGDVAQEEPACGAHYQPYGPIELAYVTAMVAEVAVDCLLKPPLNSFSRVFVASRRRIKALGGRLSEGLSAAFGENEEGARTFDLPWHSASCAACRLPHPDRAP
ncbi:ThiF family adenylyltransferase [Thioclava sp. DLFJ4-1]|uniref:ThiF family adenylyltransferase n=1 Tax=Thioclava sp. DLFJ4-1 TaxID=1915313 RepID=UPI001AEFEB95|nr:ThiF family adenylyltransferase [Thioclava sp. DLFJ4-1]